MSVESNYPGNDDSNLGLPATLVPERAAMPILHRNRTPAARAPHAHAVAAEAVALDAASGPVRLAQALRAVPATRTSVAWAGVWVLRSWCAFAGGRVVDRHGRGRRGHAGARHCPHHPGVPPRSPAPPVAISRDLITSPKFAVTVGGGCRDEERRKT